MFDVSPSILRRFRVLDAGGRRDGSGDGAILAGVLLLAGAADAVAVGAAACRSHRDAADRLLEISRLGAVEDHTRNAGADAVQVRQCLFDQWPLLAARDR